MSTDVSLSSLFTLYVFSTGRRLFAMAQVQAVARDMGLTPLVKHLASAIAQDQKTHQLEIAWAMAQHAPPKDGGRAKRVDVQVDRTLVAIRDAVQAQIDGADASDKELVTQLEGMLAAFFPTGVVDVITLTFPDELAAVDRIVHKLKNEYATLAKEIGIERLAKHLTKLAADYRAALEETSEGGGPRFDEVRAARAAGQEKLLEAVAMIVGLFPSSTKEHVAARTALLGPILKQNEAIRQYLRARRALEDVDPETGEIDPKAPPPAPSSPGNR